MAQCISRRASHWQILLHVNSIVSCRNLRIRQARFNFGALSLSHLFFPPPAPPFLPPPALAAKYFHSSLTTFSARSWSLMIFNTCRGGWGRGGEHEKWGMKLVPTVHCQLSVPPLTFLSEMGLGSSFSSRIFFSFSSAIPAGSSSTALSAMFSTARACSAPIWGWGSSGTGTKGQERNDAPHA